MDTFAANEAQIQAEMDRLKMEFPQTRDLYREACVLLFFRYGITPTANKLYQYVRKGSMSAPAEALSKFWLELRDKSRIRIEHPDLPDELKNAAGKFMGELWNQAQESAQTNFSIQMAEVSEKMAMAQHDADDERKKHELIKAVLNSTKAELENAFQRLTESGKNHAVNISALANLEKALKTLQNERDQVERSLEAARQGFSNDLDKVNVALIKAEERYRALEARSLIEVDRERQRVIKLEKELAQSGDVLREQQRLHLKELAAAQKANAGLREKLGMLTGQLTQVKLQLRQATLKLSKAEKQLGKVSGSR